MSSSKLKMPSISFFILVCAGLVAATVKPNETTSRNDSDLDFGNSTTTITTITAIITSANTPSIYMNTTDEQEQETRPNNEQVPVTTLHPGKYTPGSHPNAETDRATPTPGVSPTSTTSKSKTTTKPDIHTAGSDSTGIVILIVLIIVVAVFLTACYLVHKRRRRYSVDISSRQDEANIPLSTVEPAGPAPQNGLTTFASTEATAKEPEEPEAKPEVEAEAQEEQKAEPGTASDQSAETAAPAPDSSEDKAKGDVDEQSPPPPVEATVEEKTDDEAAVSNKTSVESLKETNENNSNNANFSQKRNLIFWTEVPLDCSV